jgi:hypothetical protein
MDYVKIEDLYVAYRKAKSEAFFDSFHISTINYSDFEKNIHKNLELLLARIRSNDDDWWNDLSFIGDYRYVPKSLKDDEWNNNDNIYYRSLDPITDWTQRFEVNKNKRLDSEFRLIICPTVEYQILSSLWILKVGHKFEIKLNKNHSYGNRLRRNNNSLNDHGNGRLNTDSYGLFSHYFPAYKKWRNDGLGTMRGLLEIDKSVTAITMDLEKFYHRVSPNFLLRPSFLKKIGLEIDANDRRFTVKFLDSMTFWYENTPDYKNRPEGAIPVGLSASKIISNILLYELDEQIVRGLEPAYYGRYVDDIFLVFETPNSFLNGNSILSYISKHVECIKINQIKGEQYDLRVRFNYANDSELKFAGSKQKIFSLSGKHGLDFIDQISNQIREQSSEYRLLPELPRNSVEMANKTLLASPDASLIPDALRKADVVSIRRLGLSLLLRDIESYSSDLMSKDWGSIREEFYGLVERYLLTPKGVFNLFGYLHRAFRLMIVNSDFSFAIKFIDKLVNCLVLIENTTVRTNEKMLGSCRDYFYEKLYEVAIQSSTDKKFSDWENLRKTLDKLRRLTNNNFKTPTESQLRDLSREILLADFGYRSYKDYWYYSQHDDILITPLPKVVAVGKALKLSLIKRFSDSAHLKSPHWPALAFPTRPLTIQEIALISPSVLSNNKLFKSSILALRGAKTTYTNYFGRKVSASDGAIIKIPSIRKTKVYVALTNFKTTSDQYNLSLDGNSDEGLKRYENINRLVNDILRSSQRSDYIVFPECSLPLRWALGISFKLAKLKISLIAGIECYTDKSKPEHVRNESLLSLSTKWPGYNSNVVILQSKHSASHHELKTLEERSKKLYSTEGINNLSFPIYRHGGFHFGVILCSDLTNPANRMRFQGLIDCLFVLEWNPDVKTFSYLVEGAAHDIHAFVVQVNNRIYGDSRVRAPYRVDYQRDSVRVKGGLSDTYVIAEVNFKNLRDFQREGVMTDDTSEFKPVPIGFKMCKSRY